MERYVIVEEAAGEGGYGRIDRANDPILERDVAIKILDPLFKDQPTESDRERFRREARSLAKLSHPNIPAIYDVIFSADQGEFRIIFEWIDGVTMHQWIQKNGAMRLSEAQKWFGHLCSALAHIHDKGIIHRDIKPSNMMIANDTCFLVDFGISLSRTDIERLTSGTALGTPGYMSPEQERGEELDTRSDIWNLGIVLYECLAGSRPRAGEYRALNTFNEAIPPGIDELIRSCLREREDRLVSVSEFYEQLSKALRPHSDFAVVLTQGALHEIQLFLSRLDPNSYAHIRKSQRILVMSRVRDLISSDEVRLQKPVAVFLEILLRIAHSADEKDYQYIVEKTFHYGYNKTYGEDWQGDRALRETLNDVAIFCPSAPHSIITIETLGLIAKHPDLASAEGWYHHDLRVLLQNLLANEYCSDAHAEELGDRLNKLNSMRR